MEGVNAELGYVPAQKGDLWRPNRTLYLLLLGNNVRFHFRSVEHHMYEFFFPQVTALAVVDFPVPAGGHLVFQDKPAEQTSAAEAPSASSSGPAQPGNICVNTEAAYEVSLSKAEPCERKEMCRL